MQWFFRSLLPEVSPSDALVLALASGIAEEVLFRGAIQPALGLWWTSLLFGLLHFPPDRRLAGWPIFAGVLGLAFGGVYELTGNLLGPIVAHLTINYVGLRRLGSIPRRRFLPG
jgi:membrane protease YdiL (CAAX protease family)